MKPSFYRFITNTIQRQKALADTTQQWQITQQMGPSWGGALQQQETPQTERCEQQGKKHPQKLQNAHPSPAQHLFSGLGKALGTSTCWWPLAWWLSALPWSARWWWDHQTHQQFLNLLITYWSYKQSSFCPGWLMLAITISIVNILQQKIQYQALLRKYIQTYQNSRINPWWAV